MVDERGVERFLKGITGTGTFKVYCTNFWCHDRLQFNKKQEDLLLSVYKPKVRGKGLPIKEVRKSIYPS